MAGQARGEATRQAIINAAVEQFRAVGYGNTALSDIIDRTQLTKGGFYYHFPTKEDLAAAVIDHANTVLQKELDDAVAAPRPALENLVQVTFVVANLMQHDPVVRMGFQLRQALNQVSQAGQSAITQRRTVITSMVRTASTQGDLSNAVDPEQVGHTIWAAILGTHSLAVASSDNIFMRIADIWTVILPGIASPTSLPYLQTLVRRMQEHYINGPSSGSQPI